MLGAALHYELGKQAALKAGLPEADAKAAGLLMAAKDLDIDLSKSWVVGDRLGDLELAWNAGARACLVKTGYGAGEIKYWMAGWKRQPDLIAENALDAALQIVEAN